MRRRFRWFIWLIAVWILCTTMGYWVVGPERKDGIHRPLHTTQLVSSLGHPENGTNKMTGTLSITNSTEPAKTVNKTDVQDIAANTSADTEKEYFTPRSTKVNPMGADFLISNEHFCDDIMPFLIVMVPSIFKRAAGRNAIRNTYGSYKRHGNLTIKLIFLFGTFNSSGSPGLDVLQESKKYGDIVQADFKDSYKNLAYKILYGLKWVSTYCPGVKYVVKADQDVFVSLPFLLDYLLQTPYGAEGAIYGNIYTDITAHRWRSKWRVTVEEYPLTKYPPYASGVCYVISGNIVEKLILTAEHMPYLYIEDAFITGCLAKTIGAKIINNEQFSNWISEKPDPCSAIRKRRISSVRTNVTMFYKFWETLNSFDKECGDSNN